MNSLVDIKEKLIVRILKNKNIIFFVAISILGLLGRIALIRATSGDFRLFLHPWYLTIKQGGIASLSHQIGNYGIPYQFIILILTLLPIKDLYAYKLFSIIFDYLLAICVALLACRLSKSERKENIFLICYSVVLMLPTVILNSSWWAQCDSIYTTFIILSFLSLFYEKNVLSFIFFGIALAFKLQAIFLLPFYLFLYLERKRILVSYYLIILFSFWACSIPGFLYRRL